MNSELLMRLIHAMMKLGDDFGEFKGDLKEVELGQYQIGIVSVDNLAYVILQDMYDNEPFTRRILDMVIDEVHETLLSLNFDENLPLEMTTGLTSLIQTMKFPNKIIPDVFPLIDSFQLKTKNISDTVILTDLDDGIVKIFENPLEGDMIPVLLEILSEIPFEKSWVGEIKMETDENGHRTHEAWFIHKIGMTDFCIAGRCFYDIRTEKENFIRQLEELADSIHELVLRNPI